MAEALLREHLKAHPTDVAAMRMLAEVGTRLGRYGDAEALLERCLELGPELHRRAAQLRHRAASPAEAALRRCRTSSGCWRSTPTNPNYRMLMAACLALLGDYERRDRRSTRTCWPSYPQPAEGLAELRPCAEDRRPPRRRGRRLPARASRWRRGWARPTGASPT